MDLYFDSEKGTSFTIEVGYFDTIQEIKEKVSKYHGIPVDEQTLKFEEKTLPDDLNIHISNIFDGSHLKLITTSDSADSPPPPPPPQSNVKTEEITPPPSSSQKIKIALKTLGLAIDMDIDDSVLSLKEKINEMEGIRTPVVSIFANGVELRDQNTLLESQVTDGSEVEIVFKPVTTSPGVCNSGMGLVGNYLKKLKVIVLSKCGQKIAIEVNPTSNVGELRNELQKVRNQGAGAGFRLPEDGYFFIYKQNVMEEDQSFRWHRVGQGDTIEIFNGCVTGGS